MRVSLDGTEIDVPAATTLGELLDGLGPRIDPDRLLTSVQVDGTHADPTDAQQLAAWRLGGGDAIAIRTETPAEFARTRREEIGEHLRRIADRLALAADGLFAGETQLANRVLATAARELGLVLELDDGLAVLDGGTVRCTPVVETVRRIGRQLNEAEEGQRWAEVASLLTAELVPALRAASGTTA
jgi:hypothetical protein